MPRKVGAENKYQGHTCRILTSLHVRRFKLFSIAYKQTSLIDILTEHLYYVLRACEGRLYYLNVNITEVHLTTFCDFKRENTNIKSCRRFVRAIRRAINPRYTTTNQKTLCMGSAYTYLIIHTSKTSVRGPHSCLQMPPPLTSNSG